MRGVRVEGDKQSQGVRVFDVVVIALLALCMTACGKKENAAASQSLVRVDGNEITVLQLNQELARANVPADKKDEATKQILEVLINQRLLEDEAARSKLDREPAVIAAIERAKAQIISQAVIQKRLSAVPRPTKEEADKYYADHPDVFAERKIYDMDQLTIRSKDFGDELKAMMAPNKTLEEMVTWLKDHHIEFAHGAAPINSAELPDQLAKKIKEMRKGQLFALQQADKTVVFTLRGTKDDPIKLEVAEPQIGKFLLDQRNKEASGAEITRLRASAKIEYLNKSRPDDKAAAAPASAPAANATVKPKTEADHIKKGVADL